MVACKSSRRRSNAALRGAKVRTRAENPLQNCWACTPVPAIASSLTKSYRTLSTFSLSTLTIPLIHQCCEHWGGKSMVSGDLRALGDRYQCGNVMSDICPTHENVVRRVNDDRHINSVTQGSPGSTFDDAGATGHEDSAFLVFQYRGRDVLAVPKESKAACLEGVKKYQPFSQKRQLYRLLMSALIRVGGWRLAAVTRAGPVT